MIEHADVRWIGEFGVRSTRWTARPDAPTALAIWEDALDELMFSMRWEPGTPCAAVLLGDREVLGPGGMFMTRVVTGFDAFERLEDLGAEALQSWSREALGVRFSEPEGDGVVGSVGARDVLGMFVHAPGSGGRPDEGMIATCLTWHNLPGRLLWVADLDADVLGCWTRIATGEFATEPLATLARGREPEGLAGSTSEQE